MDLAKIADCLTGLPILTAETLADRRLKHCRDCHQAARTQDFLFRSYVAEGQPDTTK